MDWLDDELRHAFKPQDPPPDFAGRIIARARRGRVPAFPRWALAAAAALVIASAGYGYRWQRGEAAKDQVLLAFRITAGKVNHIQMQVTR